MYRTNYKNRSNFRERLVNEKTKQNEGYSGIDSAAQLPHRDSVGKGTSAIYNLKNIMKIFLNSKKSWMPRCPRQWWKVA